MQNLYHPPGMGCSETTPEKGLASIEDSNFYTIYKHFSLHKKHWNINQTSHCLHSHAIHLVELDLSDKIPNMCLRTYFVPKYVTPL